MLTGSILGLATGTYTVTRRAGGTYDDDGYYVGGSATTFSIVAIVQPFNGRTMLPLPEGVRSEDVRHVHTATALRTRDGGGEADAIAIAGETYYAWRVAGPFTLGASTHFEAFVARRAKP